MTTRGWSKEQGSGLVRVQSDSLHVHVLYIRLSLDFVSRARTGRKKASANGGKKGKSQLCILQQIHLPFLLESPFLENLKGDFIT